MFLPSLVFSFLLASQQAPAPLPVGTQIIPAGTWNLATGNQGSSRSPGPDTVYSCDGLWSWYSTHQSSSANSYQWAVTDEFRLADRISQNWEQLNGFSLNYCTDSIDPTGAGAQLQVSFYQDYTPCTSPGVPDCTYILSGLPLSMNGNATCWSISVDLSGMECMPGLSTPFPTEDLNGASRSAGITLEFLLPAGAIGSIGPMIGGTNGYGNLDQFWVNDPSGASTGCRSWNGNPYSSFGFALQAPHAGARNYFGTLPLLQPMPLLELLPRQAVQAGSPATWDILHGGSGYFWMAASLQFGQQLILGAGALEGIGLIAPPLLSPPIPMPGASVTLPVPLAFSGKIVFLQAVETSTPSFAIPAITGISQGLLLQL